MAKKKRFPDGATKLYFDSTAPPVAEELDPASAAALLGVSSIHRYLPAQVLLTRFS